jgi:peptide/nickel transport system permease protein
MSATVGISATSRRERARDPWMLLLGTAAFALIGLAVVGPFIAPYDPDAIDVLEIGQAPSLDHPLGTDALGRDILSRALVGARLSFAGAAIVTVGSIVFGSTLALVAAWRGGWIDAGLTRVMNVLFAVPGILVAILAAAVFGVGFWAPVLALTLLYTPFVARVVRSAAVTQRRMPWIEALQLAGVPPLVIALRHLIPNLTPIIVAQAALGFGTALTDFAAVSFIGLGVQPPIAEWGVMVANGRSGLLSGAVEETLVAGTCIIATVVVFNALGERVAGRVGGSR